MLCPTAYKFTKRGGADLKKNCIPNNKPEIFTNNRINNGKLINPSKGGTYISFRVYTDTTGPARACVKSRSTVNMIAFIFTPRCVA